MKNKLIDLNNHLFEQLERLNDEDIIGDQLDEEIHRSKALCFVAAQIISNARLALDAQVAVNDGYIKNPPVMLGIEPDYEKNKAKKIHK